MLYALICTDKEGGMDLRVETRPAHLEHLKTYSDKIRFAGPFTSEDGAAMTGSLLVVEAASMDEAKAIAKRRSLRQGRPVQKRRRPALEMDLRQPGRGLSAIRSASKEEKHGVLAVQVRTR